VGEWGSHTATSSTVHGAQRSFHGASSKPMQVKWKKGPAQSYCKQGYTAQDHQYQPLEDKEWRRRKKKNNNDAFNFCSIFSFLYFQLLCKFVCA
jgi:hypothetical protein